MTLIENIKIFEALVDEFAPDSEFFTDDEDIRIKAKTLYAPVYIELANLKTNSKTKELSFTYTGEDSYEKVKLPSRKVKRIMVLDEKNRKTTGDYYYFGDTEVMISNKYNCKYVCEYIPNVQLIAQDTDDDFVLELTDELCAVLPYKVASDYLKTDPSADWTAFEKRASSILQLLDTSAKGISVHIGEGEF
jgi:hypothetical protein